MKAAEKLVQVAEQKVGYLEKEAIKTRSVRPLMPVVIILPNTLVE